MRPIGMYSRSTCAYAADQIAQLTRELNQEIAELLMLAVLNFPKEIMDAINAENMENGGIETNRQKQLAAITKLFKEPKYKCVKIHARLAKLTRRLQIGNARFLIFALMRMPEEILQNLDRIDWAIAHDEEKNVGEFLAWCRDRVEYPYLKLLDKNKLALFSGPLSSGEVF